MENSDLLINLSFLFDQPTGISNYAQNIYPHLKPLNPTLLLSEPNLDYQYYKIPNNLTPKQGSKGHFRRLLWTQFKLPNIYRKLQAKLLFSPLPEIPLYSKCNSVVMVHDLIPLRFPKPNSPLTPYFRYYIPQVLQQAQHIICNSVATAEDIINFFQISATKITPILLGYDRHHFCQLKLSCNNNTPYFLYIGRHDPHKNLHRLINAFAAIYNCRDYQLWLAGTPDLRYTPRLKLQAKELGIAEQIIFLDYVSYQDLPKIINQAIALVFPSLWEGFGFPVLEAMGCGTPVITSNLSSLPEVAGDASLLVNPYNVAEISDAMEKVANDSNLRSHLSQLSRKQASKFSWEKTGKATLKVLQKYI